MEKYDIYTVAANILCSVGLFIVAGVCEKVVSTKWRILYILPFVLCMFLTSFIGFEASMIPAYIGSVIPLIGFVKEKKKLRRILCCYAAAVTAAAVPICLLNKSYREKDYVSDFEKGYSAMREHYVLSEHKQIDWDALYEKYLIKFRAVKDEYDLILTWAEYCGEFKDGHVGFVPSFAESEEGLEAFNNIALARLGAKDFGLSMLPLEDGRIAAVEVDESLFALGIHNGTIITSWDGKDVFDAALNSPLYPLTNIPDKDNERFVLPMIAARTGGESVRVCYIDDSGAEQKAELPALGSGSERYNSAKKTFEQAYEASNFEWVALDDTYMLLRINSMTFDINSMKTENYDVMKSELKAHCSEALESGRRNLIIDLRNNGGGSGRLVMALAEVFAPKGEHFYCCDGTWDKSALKYVYDEESGTFPVSTANTYIGEDSWQGNPIVILVNANSVSASDHLNMIMSDFDNVTVMGFTEANGSAQGVGTLSLENGMLMFSGSLVLNADGTVFVDSGADRESGDDIDVRVPLDEEAIKALYDNGEDYLLKKAQEYLAG